MNNGDRQDSALFRITIFHQYVSSPLIITTFG